jgi:hypothetical protein
MLWTSNSELFILRYFRFPLKPIERSSNTHVKLALTYCITFCFDQHLKNPIQYDRPLLLQCTQFFYHKGIPSIFLVKSNLCPDPYLYGNDLTNYYFSYYFPYVLPREIMSDSTDGWEVCSDYQHPKKIICHEGIKIQYYDRWSDHTWR